MKRSPERLKQYTANTELEARVGRYVPLIDESGGAVFKGLSTPPDKNKEERTFVQSKVCEEVSELRGLLGDERGDGPDGSFDQSLVWFENFARHLLDADESARVPLSLIGSSQAALPMTVRKGRLSGLLGCSVASLTNYYSAYFAPVFSSNDHSSDDNRREHAGQLARLLVNDLPRWHTLDLNPIDRDTEWAKEVSEVLRANRCYVTDYFRFGNWYLDVDGRSFDDYFATLPGKLRNTLKRKQNKLAREKGFDFELVTDVDQLDAALAEYNRIYSLSWKVAEPHPDFIAAVCRDFAKRDWLRMGILRVEGVAAAAQIWFLKHKVASIFKLAYDPHFGKYSVGSILTKELMSHAIDQDKVDVVDYLCGDDAYKQDWMSHRRERYGLRAYRLSTAVGLWRAAVERIKAALKSRRGTEEGPDPE